MAEERRKVLTRSEGEEERCIVIKPDGQFARACHQLRRITEAARWIAPRKLTARLS